MSVGLIWGSSKGKVNPGLQAGVLNVKGRVKLLVRGLRGVIRVNLRGFCRVYVGLPREGMAFFIR